MPRWQGKTTDSCNTKLWKSTELREDATTRTACEREGDWSAQRVLEWSDADRRKG